ncbi:MAG: SDR family NAD(P)-dependent oxidoreductase [Bacteriovoracaceae bacterium]|nr:SDR family NAD(P)-dependent oxidoreductase [Bacteriovoracaceae bacterium]
MKILITGTSSGIGLGLAKYFSENGHEVYGISRRASDIQNENFHHLPLDLLNYESVKKEIPNFIGEAQEFDLVILNAGVLGKIQPMAKAELSELKHTMEMNLWSQKELLDVLLSCVSVKTVIGISSGAGVNGNLGWSGYSLSKAALNMLIQLYAQEFKQTKFYAFAPGLVDTNMQDHLWEVSEEKYPSVKKLHDARGTQNMPRPEEFAIKFEKALPDLLKLDSGKFVDLRKM